MKIGKNSVVTAVYTLKDAQDNLIEEGQEPMVYLHGGYDNVFPKIEEALEGKEKGFSTIIQLNPEDAFGDYDAALVKVEPRERFPSPLEVGMQFEGMPEESEDAEDDDNAHIFTITDIAGDKVVLDGNHPLAGIALRFSLTVEDVRAASDEEVAHGHVHGVHGHQHDDDDEDDEGMGDEYRSHPLH